MLVFRLAASSRQLTVGQGLITDLDLFGQAKNSFRPSIFLAASVFSGGKKKDGQLSKSTTIINRLLIINKFLVVNRQATKVTV